VLASDVGLQPVVQKTRQINALSKLCFDFLPAGQARLVRAVTLHSRPGDRQLVLLAASPAAAARLKLQSEALLDFLLQHGAQVNSVSVRVQPGPSTENVVHQRQSRQLSRGALDALQALLRRLPESPARKALKTLLQHQVVPDNAGTRKR
jgi:hypothetical protein